MKKKIKTLARSIAAMLPFLLGLAGFIAEGITPGWAFYHALKLYGMNWGPEVTNRLITAARWTAPLVTGSVLVVLIKRLLERIRYSVLSHKNGSCSVYGKDENARILLKNLGSLGIKGDLSRPYKTTYHIVMAENNEETVAFFGKFPKEMLKSSHVILCVNGISPMILQEENVVCFSYEENCAGGYWRENPAEAGEKIAVIGGGNLFEQILMKGLLLNIYSPCQSIEYHLWSGSDSFIKCRGELENVLNAAEDKMIYHGENFLGDYELLADMDRIILCGDESMNITSASKIQELAPVKNIHIYSKNPKGISRMFGEQSGGSVKSFGSGSKLLTFDSVVREELTETAKKINLHYKNKYGGADWSELGVFKRKSNISSAEYFPVIRRLHKEGKTLEQLSELEHIRWCRFHWLNNWHWGEKRDNERRIHTDLLPYSELTREVKDKDTENVELALSDEFIQIPH